MNNNQDLELPYRWTPRTYQRPLFDSFPFEYIPDDANSEKRKRLEKLNESKYNRAFLIKTRRYGFDLECLNIVVKESHKRVGVYYHIFPTYAQGKKDLWNGRTRDGIPFLDYVPKHIIDGKPNSSEMIIRFRNNSIYQVVGSDNYHSLRGAGAVGMIFSEWAFQDPNCMSVLSPILSETGGWAIYGSTPYGKNHGFKDYNMAKDNPDYYTELTTADNAKYYEKDINENIVEKYAISQEAIEAERARGMSESEIQREYFCSFDAPVEGSYYETEIMLTRKQKRICGVRPQSTTPVFTFWDAGYSDYTSIWFAQFVGKEIHIVNYYENCRKDLAFYASYLKDWRSENQVTFGQHILPHDAESTHIQTGTSIRQDLEALGLDCDSVKRPAIKENGHEACRQIFGQCWFDENNCDNGISGLSSYHSAKDSKKQIFLPHRVHDWASHPADAFQTLAFYVKKNRPMEEKPPTIYEPAFSGASGGGGWMGK